MYFVICFALYLILNFICIIKVRFQFLFFQAFNEAGVSLVPGLAVPRPTFPKLSINNPELVNFIYTVVSTVIISAGETNQMNNKICARINGMSTRGLVFQV